MISYRKILLGVLLVGFSNQNFALAGNYAFNENHYYKLFINLQDEWLNKSSTVKKLSDLIKDPHAQSRGSTEYNQLQACTQFLNPILSKEKIRIDYFTGYSDGHRDELHDPFEIRGLRSMLFTPCTAHSEHKLCGFSPIAGNPFLLSKQISYSDGKIKTIEIKLADAAISPSDKYNRENIDQQNKKSESVRKSFIQAMTTTDIMIYSGHSRFGGGPDFYPEQFLPNGDDNVAYYLKDKRGVKDILTGLEGRANSPYLMFMGSCDSKKHFSAALAQTKNAPIFSFLSNGMVTEDEAYKQFIAIMNLILNESCPVSFQNYFEKFELIKNIK